jgi:hypothetical protein
VRNLYQMMAVAAYALAGSAGPTASHAADFVPDMDFYPRPRRGKGQSNKRGKGKRSPPKQRPNRLHMSKRVRRKHRRAA